MNIFKVVNGELFHIVKETVNTGSKKFFKIEFVFDNSWKDFNQLRFAEFYQNIDDTHIRVAIDENGIVEVPTDIICQDLPLYVGVSAENIDGSVIPNTNFLPIAVNYGANSTENIHYPETENNFYALFSPNTSLRYLRVNNGVLEYSNDNKQWFAVSGLVSGGISEEKVAEIVEEKTKNLPTTIDAQIEENTIQLTIELKDKDGNTVSSKTIQIPQQNLADYVKFTDYATKGKAGVLQVADSGYGLELLGNGVALKISAATKTQIDERQEEYYAWASNCKPIVPATIGYAVRQVLTNPKFESETYTEEEQKKVCETIGALSKDARAYYDFNAGTIQPGIVYTNPSYGLNVSQVLPGLITVQGAQEYIIKDRLNPNYINPYKSQPLTMQNFGLVLKEMCKDNKTDFVFDETEKTDVCNTFGAVKAKSDTSPFVRIYAISTGGKQQDVILSTTAAATWDGTVAAYLREEEGDTEAGGWLVTKTPTKPYHTANMKWVEELVDGKTTLYEHYVTGVGGIKRVCLINTTETIADIDTFFNLCVGISNRNVAFKFFNATSSYTVLSAQRTGLTTMTVYYFLGGSITSSDIDLTDQTITTTKL